MYCMHAADTCHKSNTARVIQISTRAFELFQRDTVYFQSDAACESTDESLLNDVMFRLSNSVHSLTREIATLKLCQRDQSYE